MTERIHIGGITNTVLHVESDGAITIEEKQDCEAILERNQRGRDHRFDSSSKDGFYREVAEIPMVPYLAKCREINQQPFATPDVAMEMILRDPKYANFHCAPKTRDAHVIMKGVR